MDLEMLREVVPMLRQQLEKSMLDRNYVQLERDSIQNFFNITSREIKEIELAVATKDKEMELLEDNHRVELHVYQQKVKHLEYEHKNSMKGIVKDGTVSLDKELVEHHSRERDLLKLKEQLKFEQMEIELVNAHRVNEVRTQHDKQLAKLCSQFDDGLNELRSRCDRRLSNLEFDLELRRRVEIHEVEERKNQHINDLITNHEKAFSNMKLYYNEITRGNLQLITHLQRHVEELRARAQNNKRMLLEYIEENQNLSLPLLKISSKISELQVMLKERSKDQMALRNAMARLNSMRKKSTMLRESQLRLEEDYKAVEKDRDELYNTFEEAIHNVHQQAQFHNQALEQRLITAEVTVEKANQQIEEIMKAARLDVPEMSKVLASINEMLAAKEDTIKDVNFSVAKLKKNFNDTFDTYVAKFKELGLADEEICSMGFRHEDLPPGTTFSPSFMIAEP